MRTMIAVALAAVLAGGMPPEDIARWCMEHGRPPLAADHKFTQEELDRIKLELEEMRTARQKGESLESLFLRWWWRDRCGKVDL